MLLVTFLVTLLKKSELFTMITFQVIVTNYFCNVILINAVAATASSTGCATFLRRWSLLAPL